MDGWNQASNSQENIIFRISFCSHRSAWVMGQAIPELNTQMRYIGTITDIAEATIFERKAIIRNDNQ
jgi:hypothetical protein